MARMLGRLGWHGQCSCCNGPADDSARERREWQREAADAVMDHAEATSADAPVPPTTDTTPIQQGDPT